jgi:hypothetical protein
MTNDNYVTFTTDLDTNQYRLTVRYVRLTEGWYADLLGLNNGIDIKNIKLVSGLDLLLPYAHRELGSLFLIDNEGKSEDPTEEDMGDRFKFKRTAQLNLFTTSGSALVITDLSIDFVVRANRRKQPNQAELTVYNLNEQNRHLIAEEGTAIEFAAGYAGRNKLLFRGTTNNIINVKEGNTWKSMIWAGDGQKEYLNSFISAAYAAGTLVSRIIEEIALIFGLTTELDLPEDKLTTGVTFDGLAKDVLSEVCDDYGYAWSIQHGVLQVVLEGKTPSRESQATLVNSSTGLLSPPQITDKGVSFSSLLDGAIQPSALVTIESLQTAQKIQNPLKKKVTHKSADGTYIVDSVEFSGNTQAGAFNMTVEAWTNA